MTQSQDEEFSGDLPVGPAAFTDETRPSLSHEVVATYVADAVRRIPGVVDLHASAWKGLSSRMREMHTAGVVIRDSEPGSVSVEIHVKVAWDAPIPEVARQVDEAVRARVSALLSLELDRVALFVDEIDAPLEVGTRPEG